MTDRGGNQTYLHMQVVLILRGPMVLVLHEQHSLHADDRLHDSCSRSHAECVSLSMLSACSHV
jgi:hypothetical protein